MYVYSHIKYLRHKHDTTYVMYLAVQNNSSCLEDGGETTATVVVPEGGGVTVTVVSLKEEGLL